LSVATSTSETAGEAGAAHAEKVIDPIHQFEIHKLIDLGPFSLTNSGLWAIIAVICIIALFTLAPRNLIPTRFQSIA
jgi:F-type H+-transporting ATPase subunit a